MKTEDDKKTEIEQSDEATKPSKTGDDETPPKEYGGTDGPEPTRYGDWEKNGIISDF